MDDDLRALLEDIASSLRRIADAIDIPRTADQFAGGDDHGRAADPGVDPHSTSRSASAVRGHGESLSAQSQPSDGEGVEIEDRREILRGFLAERGVSIKVERERDDADELLDRLAVLIGSRFRLVENFYTRLKSNMNDGRLFTLNMQGEPQDVVSSTCQLATELHRIAFLEEYKYRKSPQYLLYARSSRLPRALNFLSGGWLERYAVAQACDVVTARAPTARYSYLKNPQIVLPNGDDFELDVLFEVEGEVFWMELKTGDYQKHIAKYSKMSRMLRLDVSRCFMVLTDISSTSAASLSALFQMTVTPVESLGDALSTAIARCHVSSGATPA